MGIRVAQWMRLAGWVWVLASAAQAQTVKSEPVAGGVEVLMLSDIHLDPFRDPAKAVRLDKAPVSEWEAILKAPDAPGQAAAFAALQQACGSKALDTDEALLDAALRQAREHAAKAGFVTISGDLLVHQFDCRYRATVKGGGESGLTAFAAKTASYVADRVRAAFPGVPVYITLGNNDTACGDYKLDRRDGFLAGTSRAVTEGLRGASAEELKQAREDYETGGYFAVTMPAPMAHTRMLVLDDVYLSQKYKNCGDKADAAPGAEVLAWLTRELDAARERHDSVWVMTHIPMGVDVYATLRKGDVCGNTPVQMFLTADDNSQLGGILSSHPDVVRLAIFGHTHMDEIRLLGGGLRGAVPSKGVASVSPVDGNRPSFTVGYVTAATATLHDYEVFVAPSKTGAGVWTREYDFRDTYKVDDFSSGSLGPLLAGFSGDPSGSAAASQSYEQFFDPGAPFSPLLLGWPQYVCSMSIYGETSYKSCVCPDPKAHPASASVVQ